MAAKKQPPQERNGHRPTPDEINALRDEITTVVDAVFPDLGLTGHDAMPKRIYLWHLMQFGVLDAAAEAADVARTRAWEWRVKDPKFGAAAAHCMQLSRDRLEQAAVRRAVEGVERGVYFKGQKIGTEREYSDVVLIFLMKHLYPERYLPKKEFVHDIGLSPALLALQQQWQELREASSAHPELPPARGEVIDAEVAPPPSWPRPRVVEPNGGPHESEVYRMLDRLNNVNEYDDMEDE
jgi:hypothetical protein